MWNKQNQYQTYLDLKFPVQICVRFVGCNIHNKWSKGEGGGGLSEFTSPTNMPLKKRRQSSQIYKREILVDSN